ncbi:MAG: anti-sigma factor [Chloroflexota bacterium]|nr:anti-sigma factor [Chloroflexota bacterium]
MNRPPQDNVRDLLGAYALGAVDAREAAEMRAFLEQDAVAEAELAELLAAVSVLPALAEPMTPPAGLRDRIAAAALADLPARPAPVAPPAPPPPVATFERAVEPANVVRPEPAFWQRAAVWATAAAALLLISLGLLYWNMQLRDEISTTPQVETLALATTEMAPEAHGEVKYMPQEGVLMLDVRNLPPLPEGYVYEVWLIGDGDPVPAGVFTDSTVQHAMAADRSQFTTLAITMEPGPMGTEAPTTEDVYATASL